LKIPFTTRRLSQWGDPARGDIVVFFSPKDGERLVKRVVGLPGDTIELRNEVLLVNGWPSGIRFRMRPRSGATSSRTGIRSWRSRASGRATTMS